MANNSDRICRLCLASSSEDTMENIFFNENDSLAKLMDLTSIKIVDLKDLPDSLCNCCKLKLNSSFEFKKQCLETNDILMKQFKETFITEDDYTKNIKLEKDIELEPVIIETKKKILINNIKKNRRKRLPIKKEKNLNFLSPEADIKIESCSSKLTNEIESIQISTESLEIERISSDSDIIKNNNINITNNRRRNNNNNRIMCQICGKMRYDIKQHMTTHTGEKIHKCPHCNKGFSQRGNLANHINIHTGNKPYQCKLCIKAFGDPNSLKSHMVTHTGERKYKCDICGNSFGYSYVLTEHKKTHIQDRRHICSFCEKPFLSREGLKKHIRIHTGEKPYKCEFCTKSFTTSWNLSTHRRVHTKERPYQCTVCQMDFAYRSVLTSHMKLHDLQK